MYMLLMGKALILPMGPVIVLRSFHPQAQSESHSYQSQGSISPKAFSPNKYHLSRHDTLLTKKCISEIIWYLLCSDNLGTPTMTEAFSTLFRTRSSVRLGSFPSYERTCTRGTCGFLSPLVSTIASRIKTASFHRALLISDLPLKFHLRFLVDVCGGSMKVSGKSGKRVEYKLYVLTWQMTYYNQRTLEHDFQHVVYIWNALTVSN